MAKVKRRYTTYEPLSLIPANGWQAVYASRDESEDENEATFAHANPLVAFAVAKATETRVYEDGRTEEADTWRDVVGYDAGDKTIDLVAEVDNFIGYLAPGESIPEWMEQQAREYVEKQAKKG